MDRAESDFIKEMLIRDVFGGDVNGFERANAKTHREKLSFNKLLEAESILPELEPHGKRVIKAMLGFIPEPFITIPHEPYIRGIINSFRMGMLTEEQLYDAAEESVIPMRNAVMFFHNEPIYPKEIYQLHNELPPDKKELVRSRITKLLGYEPNIGASISVEIGLVNSLFGGNTSVPGYLTPVDFQAMQVIKYREVLLAKGKIVADQSRLPILTSLNIGAFPSQ